MIIVTGGAGFIGSNLVAGLEERGVDGLLVCDRLDGEDKRRNIAKRALPAPIASEDLLDRVAREGGRIDAIFHLGAISSTTETDGDLIMRTNFDLPLRLWQLCAEHGIRFIYASSAATYGDGGAGFDDDSGAEALARLKPLNLYGWGKHLFDRRVARLAAEGAPAPPQWAGLKFFNVYGPNEYHKGAMKSVVAQLYPRAVAGEPARLFRSHHPDYADGGQLRDFVWVGDCVAVMLWLYDNAGVSGLFNLGTGRARSFADLAAATYRAAGAELRIDYIDTPPEIRDKYQYRTEARMERLRAAGYAPAFTSLEEGIGEYVTRYLAAPDPYL